MEREQMQHHPEEVEQTMRLLDFADICSQSMEIDTVLARASAVIIEWGLADAVGIAFPEGMLGGDAVLHVSSVSPLVPVTEQIVLQDLLQGLVDAKLESAPPERYRRVYGPNLSPIQDAVRQDQAFRLYQCTLEVEGAPYATLTLYGFQNWVLSPRSRQLLRRAEIFLSRALHHGLCLIDLERSTTEDHLTGALNRRGYERVMGREFERARRARRHMGLILIDVDHFKQLNDTYGHPVGDEVLVEVVRCTREALRCSDFICRLGGDEFAVVLPEVDEEVTALIAQRVLQACAAISVEGATVTLSMGVAAVQPDWSSTPEMLLEQADQALYASKRNGRAQVSR